jgi:tetratricopeptide (TPR) repeat protein
MLSLPQRPDEAGPGDGLRLVRQAQAHFARREFTQAEQLFLRGLAILQETVGEDDLNVTVCLNNLGMLYHILGDDARAEPLLRQVVEVRRRVLGEQDARYLHSLQDLAEFYRSCNNLEQAAVWQGQADAVEKRIAGGDKGPA